MALKININIYHFNEWEKAFIFRLCIFLFKIFPKIKTNKKALKTRLYLNNGGEHGIRTHGSFHFATFPRWCLKPLGQFSSIFNFKEFLVFVKKFIDISGISFASFLYERNIISREVMIC